MIETIANANPSPQFQQIFSVEDLLTRIEQIIKKAVKQPILPDAIYNYDELSEVTGFSLSTIIRADRKGSLLGRYQGRRRYFVGKDVLSWLADREGGES